MSDVNAKKPSIPLSIFTGVVLFFSFYILFHKPVIEVVNQPLPEFSVNEINSENKISSADFKGKVRVINFFASWCGYCKMENPVLVELKNSGIEIIGIDWKDTLPNAMKYLEDNKGIYSRIGFDADGAVGKKFGVRGTPETYVVDENGVVIKHVTGPLPKDFIERLNLPR